MTATDANLSRANIRKALELRGKTSFEISSELARNRTYLDDFLRGRKQSLSASFLQNLANSLGINREVLQGSRNWSDIPQILFDRPPISAEGVRAEREWNAATSQVSLILENLQQASGDQHKRAIAELNAARADQAVAFEKMINAEKKVLGERRGELKNEVLECIPIADYLSSLQVDVPSVVIQRVNDNALRRGLDEGIGTGDIVFIDTNQKNFMSGGVFLIDEAGSTYIRRIEYVRQQANPTIRCRATNPDFPDFEIGIDQITIVGRVVAQIRAV